MKLNIFHILLILTILFESCSFESEGIFTDETTGDCQLFDYYIDSYGNEGIVAYIHDTKSKYSTRKYIIVVSADESYQAWGPMGECVYKNDTIDWVALEDKSFGVAIHQSMKSGGIEKYPAQAWCDKKNNNEKFPRAGSWRLPTMHEFQQVCKYITLLNSKLEDIGAVPISMNNLYWTCVEDFNNYVEVSGIKTDYDCNNRAIALSPNGSTYSKNKWLKKNKYYVRAIKYIYYHD